MIIENLNQVVLNINEGDYLTALTTYEDSVRPNINDLNESDFADLVPMLTEMNQYIDDENWQAALNHVAKIEQYLDHKSN